MTEVLKKAPDFKHMWLEHLEWWGEEEAGLSNDMAAFARYTMSLLEQSDEHNQELCEIFSLIEKFLTQGDERLKDATATSFLENIYNNIVEVESSASIFINFLGPKSHQFVEGWARFSG